MKEKNKKSRKIENYAEKFKLRAVISPGDGKRHDKIRQDEPKWMWMAYHKLGWSFARIGSVLNRDPRTVRKAISTYEHTERKRLRQPPTEWEEFIDLIEQFGDSLSRISVKDLAVWFLQDAPWLPLLDVASTDKHPAELYAESVYSGLKVGLKIEEESRFRRLLLHLKRRYPEFRKFEAWKNRLGVLIKECQEITSEILLAAQDSTGMKMAPQLLVMPPILEGLYHVPKFTYDFAIDNYGKNIRPGFQVAKYDDKLYKLVPEDDPDYDPKNGLAVGSQEAIERCKAATIELCERYGRDQRVGKIKEDEKKVKDQANVFQSILSTILADCG